MNAGAMLVNEDEVLAVLEIVENKIIIGSKLFLGDQFYPLY